MGSWTSSMKISRNANPRESATLGAQPTIWGQPLQGLKQRSGMVQRWSLWQALHPSRLPRLSHHVSSQHIWCPRCVICECCLPVHAVSPPGMETSLGPSRTPSRRSRSSWGAWHA